MPSDGDADPIKGATIVDSVFTLGLNAGPEDRLLIETCEEVDRLDEMVKRAMTSPESGFKKSMIPALITRRLQAISLASDLIELRKKKMGTKEVQHVALMIRTIRETLVKAKMVPEEIEVITQTLVTDYEEKAKALA
jgi:hypothetical protein